MAALELGAIFLSEQKRDDGVFSIWLVQSILVSSTVQYPDMNPTSAYEFHVIQRIRA